MLPTVSQFLCCCGLRTGALIIGWLQVISGLTGIAANCYILSNLKDYPADDSVYNTEELTIKYLVVFILFFIIGCMLLTGVFKERPSLMRPWIILQTVSIIISLVSILIGVIYFWYYFFAKRNVGEIVSVLFSDMLNFGNILSLENLFISL